MNPLTSLLSFFKTKPSVATEGNKKWRRGYNAFEAGKKHYAEQRTEEALDCFDTAVECGFEDGTLFGLRGSCLQTLEWDLDAIDDFSAAISFEPQDCNNYYARAMSKQGAGDPQGALADIQEAIRLSRVDNALNRHYDSGAKEMGWPSTAARYEVDELRLASFFNGEMAGFMRDALIARNIERTKLKGRRKNKLQ